MIYSACLVEILGGFWPPEAEATAKRPDSGQLLTAALRTEAARHMKPKAGRSRLPLEAAVSR
jgi:hypothetical protein